MACRKADIYESDAADEMSRQVSSGCISTDLQGNLLSDPDGQSPSEVSGKEPLEDLKQEASEPGECSYRVANEDGSDTMDSDCGEPFVAQHVTIDFTPVEGVDDTDFMLQKCMSFWKLVDSSKVLQDLLVTPEKSITDEAAKSSQSEEELLLHGDFPPPRLGALEVMEEKGNIFNGCLVSKMQKRYCEEGSGDYFVDLPTAKTGALTKWATPPRLGKAKPPTRAQRDELSNLCKEMEQWDGLHPKSMDPPNHGPPHTYAVMQRTI